MTNPIKCWLAIALLFLLVVSSGCFMTHERNDDYSPVELMVAHRHEVPVELRLTEEFKTYV